MHINTARQPHRPSFHPSILLLYFLFTLLLTWPLAKDFTTAIPGDSFDGWQNYWNLWWIKVALVERVQNPLFTDLLYAPTGVGLYFHTLNPFNGLVTLPIQLTWRLIPAYNSVVLISWVLGGYGTYLLTRWLLRKQASTLSAWDHAGPFLAGMIFTFSPMHMAHLLGHMQVMSIEWIPFYILSLMRALDRQRHGLPWLRNALLAGLFLILTGLCDWYFVLYLFFFTGLLLLWHLAGEIARRISRPTGAASSAFLRSALGWFAPPVVAGLLFLLILSPMLVPMVRQATQFRFMVRPSTDLYILSAGLMDFLVPNRLHTLFRPASFGWIGNQIAPVSERTISIGYLPILLALGAIWMDRKRTAFWMASALFFLLLALGPVINLGNIEQRNIPTIADETLTQSWTPFALLNRYVPFMRISRSVSRYALMVQLSMAVMAGIGLFHLRLKRWSIMLPLICLFVLLAEYWVVPFPMSPPDTPDFYARLRELPGDGSVLNLPMNFDRPGYLLYQTVHQKPLTVAYISRDDPRTLTERVPFLQHLRHLGPDIIAVDPAAVGPTVLNDLNIDYVVLDRYKMPGGQEREVTTALAAGVFQAQTPIYEDDRLTVYAVEGAAAEAIMPYLVLGPLGWGPLEIVDDGTRRRELLGADASAAIHGPISPGSTLRIRYSSEGGEPFSVIVGDRTTELAAVPQATAVDVPLPVLPLGEAATEVRFNVPEESRVWIHALEIVSSPN